MEEKIESTRSILEELVSEDNRNLHEGKILEVSQQLDVLLTAYYENSSF